LTANLPQCWSGGNRAFRDQSGQVGWLFVA